MSRSSTLREQQPHERQTLNPVNRTFELGCERRLPDVLAGYDLPPRLVQLIHRLHAHYRYLDQQVGDIERDLTVQLREDEDASRLLSIPGIGPITASLLASEVGNVAQFEGGRAVSIFEP
ncbi:MULTISPECIES: transposase [unclassified Paraburkholderia]|uniref:transposase n=1 Tax=unclassified Paraburkholderia TaxID=2615204 RepID=UPI002AB2522F|nr:MULTISPECIES: transposase [unclassified Paraburkholderia]